MAWLRLLGMAIIVALAISACGGSSTTDGGSGGQTSTGGSGASGGSSGTGASGGSGGSGGGTIPLNEIETMCAQIDKLPCSVPNCIAEATEAAAEALQQGCAAEFAALVDCAVAHPMLCVAGKDAPQFDIACEDELDAFGQCGEGGGCGGTSNGTECEISCDGPQPYGMKCTTTGPQTVSCTCTIGPNAGESFPVTGDCSGTSGMQEAAKAFCLG